VPDEFAQSNGSRTFSLQLVRLRRSIRRRRFFGFNAPLRWILENSLFFGTLVSNDLKNAQNSKKIQKKDLELLQLL